MKTNGTIYILYMRRKAYTVFVDSCLNIGRIDYLFVYYFVWDGNLYMITEL